MLYLNIFFGEKCMKLKFKIFIISLIILILFSISFVSASQNDTLTTSDANNILTSNEIKF